MHYSAASRGAADDILEKGLGFRRNRSGAGTMTDTHARQAAMFRATTHSNEVEKLVSMKNKAFPRYGDGRTFIFELPKGKELKDVVIPYIGKGNYKFIATLPTKYIKGYVDKSGKDLVMHILK